MRHFARDFAFRVRQRQHVTYKFRFSAGAGQLDPLLKFEPTVFLRVLRARKKNPLFVLGIHMYCSPAAANSRVF
jgi:hypothetical protein